MIVCFATRSTNHIICSDDNSALFAPQLHRENNSQGVTRWILNRLIKGVVKTDSLSPLGLGYFRLVHKPEV